MDFGNAIRCLKNGEHVCREGWNAKGMWLTLQIPDTNSKMTSPYIYLNTANGKVVPWVASQTDMLSDDWQTVSK